MLDLDVGAWLEIGLALSGVAIIFFAARALMTDHAWGDGAEYEMLNLDEPAQDSQSPSGLEQERARSAGPENERDAEQNDRGSLGIEDRIVRVGISLGSGFLAFTWFGRGTPAMWVLVTLSAYALITFIAGRDPVYKKMGWNTRFQ